MAENEQISESLNNFFADIITNLCYDLVLRAIEKYKNHPKACNFIKTESLAQVFSC